MNIVKDMVLVRVKDKSIPALYGEVIEVERSFCRESGSIIFWYEKGFLYKLGTGDLTVFKSLIGSEVEYIERIEAIE